MGKKPFVGFNKISQISRFLHVCARVIFREERKFKNFIFPVPKLFTLVWYNNNMIESCMYKKL